MNNKSRYGKPVAVGDIYLSAREAQVLRLVCAGQCNKQICDALKISIKTVEKHRQRCNEKLKVNCAVAMARVALRTGVITLEEFLAPGEGENIRHGCYSTLNPALMPAWFVR